jgi:hypothetical protein
MLKAKAQWSVGEGKKMGGDECKIEELKEGGEGKEISKGRGRVFYVKATEGEVK